jgi:hypothetical protein
MFRLPDGFIPKTPILVNFGGMENAAILYDHLEYFLVTLCPL